MDESCEEKQRLFEEMREAFHALSLLQSQQSLIKEEASVPGIETALESARVRWDRARLAYAQHLKEHDC